MLMMSMTSAFADNEENNSVNSTNAYEMNISMHSLGRTLNLNRDQYDFVEDAINAFCADMMSIATTDNADRKAMIRSAVQKNLSYTHGILNKAQFRKYVMLLNATLNNRGLNFWKKDNSPYQKEGAANT